MADYESYLRSRGWTPDYRYNTTHWRDPMVRKRTVLVAAEAVHLQLRRDRLGTDALSTLQPEEESE